MSNKQRRVPRADVYGRIKIRREEIERSKDRPGVWNNLSRSQKAFWSAGERTMASKKKPTGQFNTFDGGEIRYPTEPVFYDEQAPIDLGPLEQIFRAPVEFDNSTGMYRLRGGPSFSRAEVESARSDPASFIAMVRAKQEEMQIANTSNSWDRFLVEKQQRKSRDEQRLYEAQRTLMPIGGETRILTEIKELRWVQSDTVGTIQTLYGRLSSQLGALEARMNIIVKMLEDGYRPKVTADPKRAGRLYRKD